MQFPEMTGLNSVSSVVVEAEAITVAGRTSSPTMSPDHRAGDHPPALQWRKQYLYSIYSRQAQAASVTAADLQLAERPGGDCEDVEASAGPATSDDQSILPTGEAKPVLSGTTNTLERIEFELGILLAGEESSSE
jgi:hypothetical protein